MFKWFRKVTLAKESEVDKLNKLFDKFKESEFGKNYLVEISENGGDFSYSSFIFFIISNKNIKNEDIIANSPIKIKEIEYFTFNDDRRVSVRKNEYSSNNNIIKIDEYNSLLYTLINNYDNMIHSDKVIVANEYMETLEKLYNFTINTRVYLISDEDYDLVKDTLTLILDNMKKDLPMNKNMLREELKMEVKYLNTLREKQIEMKEFERSLL